MLENKRTFHPQRRPVRSRKKGQLKDLSDSDKSPTVMAIQMDQSLSRITALVGFEVDSIYQKSCKKETVVNQRQRHGRPSLTDIHGEPRLAPHKLL